MSETARDEASVGDAIRMLVEDVEGAWLLVEAVAERVARRLRRRYHLDDTACADLARDALVVAAADGFAALRRADRETPVAPWLCGIAKNLLRQQARNERRRDRRELHDVYETADWRPGAANFSSDRSALVTELLNRLTPEQRRVLRALLDAATEREAATALGRSGDHVHDVRRRATHRLISGEKWTPPPTSAADRMWAAEEAARVETVGDVQSAKVLRAFADGRTRDEIAAATGLTAKAVKERIRRRRPRDRGTSEPLPPGM